VTSIGVAVYSNRVLLKDMLLIIQENILPTILPNYDLELIFERTKTTINGNVFHSDFCFVNSEYSAITRSDIGKKATSVSRIQQSNILYTTLDVLNSIDDMLLYLQAIGLLENIQEIPEWLNELSFYDDEIQKKNIIACNSEIALQMERKETAELQLHKNTEYKCALIYGDQDLVGIIFRILGQILDHDFSGFEDKKVEDFRIELDNITFIGEIKGVNSNVKSEHVSQVDRHYHKYLDELEEVGETKNVKQILIVNSMRNLPVVERKPVGQTQIDLAIRNNCLIILTTTLLSLFECFLSGKITSTRCRELFENASGELKTEQFLL
jgi:hypothetical protein